MFDPNDDAYLLRNLSQNNCILFLGAGFCWEMKNRLGQRMPLGGELARDIWQFLRYTEPFSSSMTLSKVFELLLSSGRPENEIRSFLEDRLLTSEIPSSYDCLADPFWYRIYTTNVDDSLGHIFRNVNKVRLDEIFYPNSAVKERSQFLDSVQAIYLHGKLPCAPNDLTFSLRQYARRSAEFDRLYDIFVGDYSTRPTVFVGTELDEPAFYQYIESRQRRGEAERELRPRSFLISPTVNQGISDLLLQFNITAYKANTAQFLSWLKSKASQLPSRDAILRERLPTLAGVRNAISTSNVSAKALERFSAAFHEVPLKLQVKGKSRYLLGSSPRWEDIHADLDAARDVSVEVLATVEERLVQSPGVISVLALLGSAGCGKSTILRRVGLTLAQRGHKCYLTNCEELPPVAEVAKVLDAIGGRVVLLFDNAEGALGFIAKLANALATIDRPPVCLVASRSNEFYRRFGKPYSGELLERPIPHLNRGEIDRVLNTLEKNNLLGKLRNKTYEERVREFSIRAAKQILVAMREATEGVDFDKIIVAEFSSLGSTEAKVLDLCVGLCTDAGYRVEKAEFIRFSKVRPAEALEILERDLRDVVLRTGQGESLLLLRHRRIAEFLVDSAAPRDLVLEAYNRVLPVLAPSTADDSPNTRRAKLYRELINHQALINRFSSEPSYPREIYDDLGKIVGDDAQYYLQYGCFELQAGELDFASNYLAQARGLDPGNRYVINAQGQLFLKQAVSAENREAAVTLRAEGNAMLDGNYDIFGHHDAYYYAIVGEENLNWIKRWCKDEERRKELELLSDFVRKGRKEFARSRELLELEERVKESYLRLAVR